MIDNVQQQEAMGMDCGTPKSRDAVIGLLGTLLPLVLFSLLVSFATCMAGTMILYKNGEGQILATDTALSEDKLREGGWAIISQDQQFRATPAVATAQVDDRVAYWNSALESVRTSLASRRYLSEFTLEAEISELKRKIEEILLERKSPNLSNEYSAWLRGISSEFTVILAGFVDELKNRTSAGNQGKEEGAISRPENSVSDEKCNSGIFSTENHSSYFRVYFTNTSPRDCKRVVAYCLSQFWGSKESKTFSYEGNIQSGVKIKVAEITPSGHSVDYSSCKMK